MDAKAGRTHPDVTKKSVSYLRLERSIIKICTSGAYPYAIRGAYLYAIRRASRYVIRLHIDILRTCNKIAYWYALRRTNLVVLNPAPVMKKTLKLTEITRYKNIISSLSAPNPNPYACPNFLARIPSLSSPTSRLKEILDFKN